MRHQDHQRKRVDRLWKTFSQRCNALCDAGRFVDSNDALERWQRFSKRVHARHMRALARFE